MLGIETKNLIYSYQQSPGKFDYDCDLFIKLFGMVPKWGFAYSAAIAVK